MNETCPDIKPYENFKASAGKKYYKIYYHMPTDELEVINPLYYPTNVSLNCFIYTIDFDIGSFSTFLYSYSGDSFLFKYDYTSSLKSEYTIDYRNTINSTICNRDVIYDMKLIDAYENNNILVYWTCKNLANNTSVQGSMILVDLFNSVRGYEVNTVMNNFVKITNKKISDFRMRNKTDLYFVKCPLSIDLGFCDNGQASVEPFDYSYLLILTIILLIIIITLMTLHKFCKNNNEIITLGTN